MDLLSRFPALAALLSTPQAGPIAPSPLPASLRPGRRVQRGAYTRNRKSRGMNPKKRLRMERRRIERETQKRLGAPPMGQYLAYAVAPPQRGVRTQAVLAEPIELGPVAPVERAREHFARHLPDDQAFEIKLRRPSC